MPDIFVTWLHPNVLAMAGMSLVALAKRQAKTPWPPPVVLIAWIAIPAALNPLLWWYGMPLFGWELGGLGGALSVGVFLPWNGLLLGFVSIPILARLVPRNRSWTWQALAGIAVETLVLIAWLAVASGLRQYVGNLSA